MDLKTENVVLSPDGTAKIIDFSLAREIKTEDQSDFYNLFRYEGTLNYRSPEQLLGSYTTKASDMWACGLILVAMILGNEVVEDLMPEEDQGINNLCLHVVS